MPAGEKFVQPFAVHDCALIAIATGSRAETLKDLRDNLLQCHSASIYYHFWGGLLYTRFEEREYNNDFAAWARHALHDRVLGERLAVIDPTAFATLEDLRRELVEVTEQRMDELQYLPAAQSDQQFEFIQSQTVVFDTGRRLSGPEQLAAAIPELSAGSIFFHFIEARQRAPGGVNDFQAWLQTFGPPYSELADAMGAIDPFFSSLTGLRRQIASVLASFLGAHGHA